MLVSFSGRTIGLPAALPNAAAPAPTPAPTVTLTDIPTPDEVNWSNITASDVINWLLDKPLSILIIIVGAYLVRWLAHRFINTFIKSMQWRRNAGDSGSIAVVDPLPTSQMPLMKRSARKAARALDEAGLVNVDRQGKRLETLGSLLRSISSVVIWSMAVLMVGYQLGINMAPIIASAGVGGIAIAFGAQSVVKDFISGLFMMFEDQYGVGDIIDTGEAIGTVEEVTLRVTRLRDASGVVWYVRNGEIIRIANRTQGFETAIIDIPVSIEEDPTQVIDVLRHVVSEVYAEPQWRKPLLEEPNVAGVETLEAGTMTIRILAKCVANQQWGVMREIRARSKKALQDAGIDGPLLEPLGASWATHAAVDKGSSASQQTGNAGTSR